jgi:hypothetical protein
MLTRARAAILLILAAIFLVASGARGASAPEEPSLDSIGRGAIELTGPWKFRRGDNPAWALPAYNDSQWSSISPASSWGEQGDTGYTGFAWYRLRLDGSPAARSTPLALLLPPVNDAYEVYWNGRRIGGSGHVPPHPQWFYTTPFTMIPFPGATSGVLAIRVWKSPLLFVDPDSLGGFTGVPILGDQDAVAAELDQAEAASGKQFLYQYTLMVLYGFVALLSGVMWLRNRKSRLFLWLAVFAITPVVLALLQDVSPIQISISYAWGRGLNQPIYVLNHVSLWFLLLYLLRLDRMRWLHRLTDILAIATLAAGTADGALAILWGSAGHGMQWADAVLTVFIMAVEIFPFVLIALGLREHLEGSRWTVAISALVSQMISIVGDAGAAGQRFTHWHIFQTINSPLFIVDTITFTAADLAGIVLFLAVLYAVYRYSMEQQARQSVLEREMHSAQEIQRVLIPAELPPLEGFAVTSAYQPALEVGGDFFQIIAETSGSTIVALGDVSGKGLKAAMNVSLIVGVLRSLSDAQVSPAEILNKLNRCLCGRLQNGFVTAVILRLDRSGSVTLANAGHLPPMLNGRELTLEGSLPLGLVAAATYDEIQLRLGSGDQLSLFTDGLLEARAADGELYGFDRVHALFAAKPSAQQAMEAAVAFGQDDDITVLTLTRLAAWEESSTSLVAPLMETAAQA